MKKIVSILAAVALLVLGTAALAADTATINVSATVLGTCAFAPATPTLALVFPPHTGGTANLAPLSANAAVDVVCSNGTPWTINSSVAPGAFFLTDAVTGSPDSIPYTFTLALGAGAPAAPPLAGTGTGLAQTVNINGTIAAGGIGALVMPAVYTQTVTLDLQP